MRFVPKTNDINSPRRRRPGLVGNGPFQPPVLARLPEIKPEPEEPEVVAEELSTSERNFRFDSAHAAAEQAQVPKSPAMNLQMVEQPATVSELPVMPTTESPDPSTEFSETAARILVETEQAKSRVKHRIDPGIAPPVSLQSASKNKEVAEKRHAVRSHTAPELTALDSPWHDWIVKLGGTFIAGLLLLMAYQSLQPKTPTEYSVMDGSVVTEDLRVATVPVNQAPANLGVLEMVPSPEITSETPVFINPAEVQPPESIQPVEETSGPDVFDSLTSDLLSAPEAIEPQATAPEIEEAITPTPSPTPSYPSTGYSAVTRVKSDVKPAMPIEQPLTPKPDFNLFPDPSMSPAAEPSAATTLTPPTRSAKPADPADAEAVSNPIWKPIAVDPNYPPAVKLNGTIQQFSR